MWRGYDNSTGTGTSVQVPDMVGTILTNGNGGTQRLMETVKRQLHRHSACDEKRVHCKTRSRNHFHGWMATEWAGLVAMRRARLSEKLHRLPIEAADGFMDYPFAPELQEESW